MFRFLLYSVVAVFLITLIRAFIGVIMKGFAELFHPDGQPGPQGGARPQVPMGGTLVKDPVCGTYVAEQSAVKLTANGQTICFCSAACRDKYKGS
jgi:YHS domain-containing protein